MTRIARSTYRYKRPPRKRAKAAAAIATEPLIVTAKQPKPRKSSDPPVKRLGDVVLAADIVPEAHLRHDVPPLAPSAAIVTARRLGKRRYADVPEMTEEESRRRGDAADALFREIKRQIAEKVRP